MKPVRPVFHEEIGAQLEQLRKRKGWSVKQAVDVAAARGQTGLSENTLTALEAGKTKHPPATVLKAAAKAYDLDYEQLAWRFITANYGITPTFPVSLLAPALSPEVEAAARALEHAPAKLRTALIESLYRLLEALGIGPKTGRNAAPDRGTIRGTRTTPK